MDLIQVWGDLPMMTSTAFVLCTNMVHTIKITNLLRRKQRIEKIVRSNNKVLQQATGVEERKLLQKCNRGTTCHLFIFLTLTSVTLVGLAVGAVLDSEDKQLLFRAWYPFDWRKSPAYEITYFHQIFAIYLAACLNVSKDILVVSLIAQCRCRLRLLAHALKTLCHGMKTVWRFPKTLDVLIQHRLRDCTREHQRILTAVNEIQNCFSAPTFAQFSVSLVIICVTAFQMTSQTGNLVRMLSMATYLLNMMEQVFIYCYEGSELLVEMLKVSYSFFTVLRQVDEES
ncbi:unnamed protein product [Leptosia nina]|uniref:Uncharacterized protein n=1 Tax=Leptosia nina TaxID=320188 RepID=A0AAV1K1G7_9NEOP